MADGWDGDWFSEDLSAYATLLANINADAVGPHRHTPPQHAAAGRPPPGYESRYQYEYGQSFSASNLVNGPKREITDSSIPTQPVYQRVRQAAPTSTHSSPQFATLATANLGRVSSDRSQPSTPITPAIIPILPSQQLISSRATNASTATVLSHHPKRVRSDTEAKESAPKRRPSSSAIHPVTQSQGESTRRLPDLSDEERLLIQLKQDQHLPWKDISREFENRFGRPFQVPALQMRYKRLRERLRPWTDQDIAALEASHEYWESNKYEIIASKMLDFGVQDRWPARYCERKWEQLHPEASGGVERAMQQEKLQKKVSTSEGESWAQEWPIPSPPQDAGSPPVAPQFASPRVIKPRNTLVPERGGMRPQ